MKKNILYLVLILAINFSLAAEEPNNFKFSIDVLAHSSQVELNNAAKLEFLRADQKLQDIYQRIVVLYEKNPLVLRKLEKAQGLWIKYRNAHMESIFPDIDDKPGFYGSTYFMGYYIELSNFTWKRVIELDSFIHGSNNGDILNGIRGVYDLEEIL